MSYADDAQRAAEDWLGELDVCLLAELDGEEVEWPAGLLTPYDGCDTCRVRETLMAAEAHMYRGALELLEDAGAVDRVTRKRLEKNLPEPLTQTGH